MSPNSPPEPLGAPAHTDSSLSDGGSDGAKTAGSHIDPGVDKIQKAWKDAVDAPTRIAERSEELFRRMAGVDAPSSVVRSAEGFTEFDGLRTNNNGNLSEVARQALATDNYGQINPASRRDHSSKTPPK